MTSTSQNDFSITKQNKSFSVTHFGSDLLCAAWIFVASSILYYIATAINVSHLQFLTTLDIIIVNYIALLVSSVAYTIAAIIVLTVSYDEPLHKLITDVSTVDIEKLNFIELYFTGNVLLVTSWLIFLGTVPLTIYPIWGIITGYTSVISGTLYLIFLVFLLMSLYAVVVVCFPENLLKLIHSASSYHVLNFFRRHCICCCGEDSILAYYLKTDYIFSLWIVYLTTVFGTIGGLYYVVVRDHFVVTWLGFWSSFLFAVGSYLYAIDSYTMPGESSYFHDFFCCIPKKVQNSLPQSDRLQLNEDERMPLVYHSSRS